MLRFLESTAAQYLRIESSLPRHRGHVSLSNLQVLKALLYVAEQGCKGRGLPKRFGNWHTIYTRLNHWSKNGVWDGVLERFAAGADRAPPGRGRQTGLDHRPGASGRHRRVKKTGRRPSENPAAEAPPRFPGLPQMLERP